jgi:hypothetical protein
MKGTALAQVMTTDQWNLCRHGRTRFGNTTNAWSTTLRMSINHGNSAQYSNWAVAVAIVYERNLNITEILTVCVCVRV